MFPTAPKPEGEAITTPCITVSVPSPYSVAFASPPPRLLAHTAVPPAVMLTSSVATPRAARATAGDRATCVVGPGHVPDHTCVHPVWEPSALLVMASWGMDHTAAVAPAGMLAARPVRLAPAEATTLNATLEAALGARAGSSCGLVVSCQATTPVQAFRP